MSGQQQSEQQSQPAFQPAPSAMAPAPAAAPAGFGVGGVTAPQAPMKLSVAESVFGHMADFLTLGGVPVASTAGPGVTAQAGGQVGAAVGASASAALGADVKAPPTVAAYGATLDKQLDAQIQSNQTSRTTLDAQRKAGTAGADATEQGLNGNRQQLLDQLNERGGVFDHDIAALNAQMGQVGKNPTPEQKALIAQRDQLQANKDKYSAQQTALSRWHDRNEINDINTQLQNPALTAEQKTALLSHKRTLATGLLSTTKHYEQFDSKWGNTTYGPKGSSTMRQGGCGPTALADLMDFHDQEDPEGQHARGVKDPYDPRKMADYAGNGHGRVPGQGTYGVKMMGDLQGSFPGVKGNALGTGGNLAQANESLNNGIPVLFSGSNLNGSTASGKAAKAYKAHYMVLNGISEDGQTYNVQDGGRNNAANIHTMSKKQAGGIGNMFNVQNSHPAVRPNS